MGAEKGLTFSYPTNLSHKVTDAIEYINQKKYDLASKLADEMEGEFPGFLGIDFVRFYINQKKGEGYYEEASNHAERLIKEISVNEIPKESRAQMKKVYVWLSWYYRKVDRKKDSEEIFLQALSNWSDDAELKAGFEKIFGYKPTIN